MSRKGLKVIRDMERAVVRDYNRTGVALPNPDRGAPFDRHLPISSDDKARAFGMEPISPKRLFDLPWGDAGCGQTMYRLVQVLFPMGTGAKASELNYSSSIAAITNRSSTQTARYFHVSVFGTGVRRASVPGALTGEPLSISQIRSSQFEQVYLNDAAQTPLGPRYIPSVCTCQARAMIHDESGQRFVDFDVIGNRSVNFYAWGVTLFILVKPEGYEVDAQNPGEPLPFNEYGYENDAVGCRVLPVLSNITENPQNRTVSVSINGAVDVGVRRIVPIPPGARMLQIFSNEPNPGAVPWECEFWMGRSNSSALANPGLGVIDWVPNESKTEIVTIPNASAVAIRPLAATVETGFSLVFEVQP